MHQLTRSLGRPPEINNLPALIKNIIFILTAAVSFSLWLSSTITTPKRIDKLEEAVSAINAKQSAVETKTNLIYSDLQEIKTIIMKHRQEK